MFSFFFLFIKLRAPQLSIPPLYKYKRDKNRIFQCRKWVNTKNNEVDWAKISEDTASENFYKKYDKTERVPR